MSYNDVLKMLEEALNDADQLEGDYDVCTSTMANLDSNRAKAKKSGLSFSDDLYNEAKEKFDSGDCGFDTQVCIAQTCDPGDPQNRSQD